jgi:hypothetical protein
MTKQHFTNCVLLLALSPLLASCGLSTQVTTPRKWLTNGSIALYREVKVVEPTQFDIESISSFAPINKTFSDKNGIFRRQIGLSLNPRRGILTLRGATPEPLKIPFEGSVHFPQLKEVNPATSASLTLSLKQEEPLWYAPDQYFEKRGLKKPAKYSAERFRRGALGPIAIFLSGEVLDGDADSSTKYEAAPFAIHTAPFWSKEVGGLRVSEDIGEALYKILPVGLKIPLELAGDY